MNNLQTFTDPENLNKITELAETITILAQQANATIVKIDTVISENRYDIRHTVSSFKAITDRLDQP